MDILKGKRIFQNKNILTLASILSVLLALSLVCTGCLFVLNRLGVFELPRAESIDTHSTGDAFSLPIFTPEELTVEEIAAAKEKMEGLLLMLPFADQYYIKVYVSYFPAGNSNHSVQTSLYDVALFGDKYKITRYNTSLVVEEIITCDGKRVQVIDYRSASMDYFALSPEFSFVRVAPFPDFSLITQEDYAILDYTEENGICTVSCFYPKISATERINFSMETGIPTSISVYYHDQISVYMEFEALDLNFSFTDSMFAID